MPIIIVQTRGEIAADTTAPSVTSVAAEIGLVSWYVDESSRGQVKYGPTTDYGYTSVLETSFLDYHSQPCPELAAGWHYSIYTEDAAGNTDWTADATVEGTIATPYGPAMGADDLNNSKIGGPWNEQMSIRFTAATTSTLVSARVYVLSIAGGSYGDGTYGTVRMTLQTDDGTSNHFPSGTALATYDAVHPSTGVGTLWTFSSPPSLTAGTIYHLVFENIDATPEDNWCSIDNIFLADGIWTDNGGTSKQPRWTDLEWCHLNKVEGGSWTATRSEGGLNTPIADLTYGDSTHQGQGYLETWGRGGSDGYLYCNGAYAFRETFTVSGSDRSVSSVSVRLARTSGTSPLALRVETTAGAMLATATIAAVDVDTATRGGSGHGFGQTWHTATLSEPITLVSGSSYNLVFSTVTGTEYWTVAMAQGGPSAYGYDSSTLTFQDGHAERFNGSTWSDVLTLAGALSTRGDFQFFFI